MKTKKSILILGAILVALPLSFFAQVQELGKVNFAFGSDITDPTAKSKLDSIARIVNESTGTVYVYGHADFIGSNSDNIALSENRCRSVIRHLFYRGVDTDRMVYKGYGEERPKDTATTADARAVNRHVSLWLLPTPQSVAGDPGPQESHREPYCAFIDTVYLGRNQTRIRIMSNRTTVIFGPNKLRITVPPGAFELEVPEDSAEIDFQVETWLTEGQMMMANLPTISDGEGMMSAGVFEVSAFQNGKRLNYIPDSSIEIRLPAQSEIPGMKLWEMDGSDGVNWQQTDQGEIRWDDDCNCYIAKGQFTGKINADLKFCEWQNLDCDSCIQRKLIVKVKKIKKRELHYLRMYASVEGGLNVLPFDRISKRRYRVRPILCAGMSVDVTGYTLYGSPQSRMAEASFNMVAVAPKRSPRILKMQKASPQYMKKKLLAMK